MGQTVVEKIAQAHRAEGPPGRPLRAGDFLNVRPRHVLTHDNTAPVMSKFRAIGAQRVVDPSQPVFALDHDIQNDTPAQRDKYARIEAFAAEQGIDFHPAGMGIGHQLMVERCYALPGAFVVASDSHANTYGALGALGTPVVRTDAAAIWAGGSFWWQIPRTVRVQLTGRLPRGSSGKDVILTLCGLYSSGEVLNAAVEFGGPGVATLSLEARLTIANMTTEWGALVGWFGVDEVTLDYLRQRREALAAEGIDRPAAQDLSSWEDDPIGPDQDALYDATITLDLSTVRRQVTGPDTVQLTQSARQLMSTGVAIQKAYLLSCTNGRLEDLTAAADVLRGQRVAEGVELYVAAASREVQERAEETGVWGTLLAAGARPLPPGCGPCIGLGEGLLEAGEVGISATNRNFKGRMGSRDAQCFLASPAVVAASAMVGSIHDPGVGTHGSPTDPPERNFRRAAPPVPAERGAVQILDGFPARVRGRLVLLPADNLNTDGIYGKDYTYRDDMTAEQMAAVVMQNYDPGFAARTAPGDVLVGGFNFGTGSSREQAATALQAKGIPLLIAGSYSQTYLRNAFNNGYLCLQSPQLVEHLRERLAGAIAAGEKTIIPGDELEVDFAAGTIALGEQRFGFPPMSEVPQALVVAGGVENLVRRRLGIETS